MLNDLHKNPLIIAGDFFFDRYDASGNPSGIVGPIETTEISVALNADTIEQSSFSRSDWGAVRSSVTLPGSTEVSVVFQDITPDVLAMVLLGDVASASSGAGAVTDESVTASLDKWVQLANGNIDAGSVTVTDSVGTTTYSEGTDYLIEYATGMILALSSGAIAQGQALLVDYAHSALSTRTVDIGTQSQVRIWARIVGENKAVPGQRMIAEFPSLSLRPSDNVPLKGEEFMTVGMTGVAELAQGYASVGTIQYIG